MNRIMMCFPGGRHKALTLSYDDGRSADRRLVDMLEPARAQRDVSSERGPALRRGSRL